MSRYQCYVLTPSQHIAREKNIVAADDSEALQKCRIAVSRLRNCRAFELWRGDHRIGSEFDENGVTASSCNPYSAAFGRACRTHIRFWP